MDYLDKKNIIKINEIKSKGNSFCSDDYYFLKIKNNNIVVLKDILKKDQKGFEPGSKYYKKEGFYKFIRISDMSSCNFTFTNEESDIFLPNIKKQELKNGDLCYQTASNVGNVCLYKGKNAYYNSHIKVLETKKDKYYIFSFLKSSFCREQVISKGSIKGVDNFDQEKFLNTIIPFPNVKNNFNPKNVEQMVSLITQNIINKEEQIKIKNKKINEIIENELVNNQNSNNPNFRFPKISEIKYEERLDTGLYSKNFIKNISLINNYINGFYKLENQEIITGRTPKDYIFTNKKTKNTFLWLTPKNIKNRTITNKTYLHTKQNTNTKKDDIIFTAIGSQGYVFLNTGEEYIYINQNTCAIRIKDKSFNNIFALCFLSSNISRKIIKEYTSTGSVPAIYPRDIKKLKIPKFSQKEQSKIIKLYFNPVNKLKNQTINNYLNNELKRNEEIGIYQLNMELFDLREQLNKIIHKIIMNKSVEINFDY